MTDKRMDLPTSPQSKGFASVGTGVTLGAGVDGIGVGSEEIVGENVSSPV